MEKQIIIGTTLKDNPTNISYVIVELLKDGFNCKPKTSAKNIQHEKYTFEEIQKLFIDSTIDIEGFEHTDADSRLVVLIMEGYIKDSLINEYKSSLSNTTIDKTSIESNLKDNELLMKQQEQTITEQEQIIHDQSNELAQLRIIKSEYDLIKPELQDVKIKLDNISQEFLTLNTNVAKEKAEWVLEKELWEKEKLEYENTIQGMEIANQ